MERVGFVSSVVRICREILPCAGGVTRGPSCRRHARGSRSNLPPDRLGRQRDAPNELRPRRAGPSARARTQAATGTGALAIIGPSGPERSPVTAHQTRSNRSPLASTLPSRGRNGGGSRFTILPANLPRPNLRTLRVQRSLVPPSNAGVLIELARGTGLRPTHAPPSLTRRRPRSVLRSRFRPRRPAGDRRTPPGPSARSVACG